MTHKYLNKPSEYNKTPFVEVKNNSYRVINGWDDIVESLKKTIQSIESEKKI